MPHENPRSKYDALARKLARAVFLDAKKEGVFELSSPELDALPQGEEFVGDPVSHFMAGGNKIPVIGGIKIGLAQEPAITVGGWYHWHEPKAVGVIYHRTRKLRTIDLQDIAFQTQGVVRHEMEHAMQRARTTTSCREDRRKPIPKTRRSMTDIELFRKYYLNRREIEAYASGIYMRAKKRGVPFADELYEFSLDVEKIAGASVPPRMIKDFIDAVEDYAIKRYPKLTE